MPPRKSNPTNDLVQVAFTAFLRLPLAWKAAVVGLGLVAVVVYFATRPHPLQSTDGPEPDLSSATSVGLAATPMTEPDGSGRYLFCFWNVENLFDDVNDKRRPTDEVYDQAFATDPHFRQLKFDRLASALVKMNGGRGPDIIGCAEVETPRTAELLRAALNAKLTDPKLMYTNVEMKELDAGRHIATTLITRLPVDRARTRLRGSKVRVLETHLRVNGYDLCAVVAHWTSQLSQKGGGEDINTGRGKYASILHGLLADVVEANPEADFLVCGDFNDTPDSDAVVKVLDATAARPRAGQPALLDLMADKSPEKYGTIWYGGKPLIYDQICVSAGLLDGNGWRCDPDTVRTVTDGLIRPGSSRRQPWRFGNPQPPVPDKQRGYSDHFPVTVELTVAPPGRP